MKELFGRLRFCLYYLLFGAKCSDLQVVKEKNTYLVTGYIITNKGGKYLGYHFRNNKGQIRKMFQA